MAYFLIKSDVSKCPFTVWQHCNEPKAFMGSRIGSFLEKGYFRDMVLKVAPWLCAHWQWKKPLGQNVQQSRRMLGGYLLSPVPDVGMLSAAVRPVCSGLDTANMC